MKFLCENQSSFRQNYITLDNIFCYIVYLNYFVAMGKKLFCTMSCTFIEFKSAFDKVWREWFVDEIVK